MYKSQIAVRYKDRVNPYSMRVDREYKFENGYGKFNFVKMDKVKNMELGEVIEYMLDLYDFENFLKYLGKYKKASVVSIVAEKVKLIALSKKAA